MNLSSQLWYCLIGLIINGLAERSGNLVAQRRLYWLDDQPGLSCVAIGPSCIELRGGRCRLVTVEGFGDRYGSRRRRCHEWRAARRGATLSSPQRRAMVPAGGPFAGCCSPTLNQTPSSLRSHYPVSSMSQSTLTQTRTPSSFILPVFMFCSVIVASACLECSARRRSKQMTHPPTFMSLPGVR